MTNDTGYLPINVGRVVFKQRPKQYDNEKHNNVFAFPIIRWTPHH